MSAAAVRATPGTLWIYTEALPRTRQHTQQRTSGTRPTGRSYNRAKSRDRQDPNGTLASPGWGYSWLVNRRVLYNNNVRPRFRRRRGSGRRSGLLHGSRLVQPSVHQHGEPAHRYERIQLPALVPHDPQAGGPSGRRCRRARYDQPALRWLDLVRRSFPGSHRALRVAAVRATRRPAKWGRNTKGTAAWDLVPADTEVAGRGAVAASTYPLVLTTIRCVEHFQGGPITRNNPYNVEQEPEPWIELNSVDARSCRHHGRRLGQDRDRPHRGFTNDRLDTDPNLSRAAYGQGFKARVGTGTTDNQRVAPGVVAIPWHWGDKGLSTGSRANDLCIDAMDANTTIPEYKACLCRIEKM